MFSRLTPSWHVSVFENRLEILEPKTGRSGARWAGHLFSSGERLILDDQILEHELSILIDEVFGRAGYFGRYPEMTVVHLERTISAEERELLRTALANAGASRIKLAPE